MACIFHLRKYIFTRANIYIISNYIFKYILVYQKKYLIKKFKKITLKNFKFNLQFKSIIYLLFRTERLNDFFFSAFSLILLIVSSTFARLFKC
jgi:hypothetical protein